MGYCVTIEIEGVAIAQDKAAACLKAIVALFDGGKTYSWVDKPRDAQRRSLVEMFKHWAYNATAEEGETCPTCGHAKPGRVTLNYYNADKWGSDETLYNAIAPFVEGDDGVIKIIGEDGDKWRYLFKGGKAVRQDAKTTWE
jgi:hypothetical protein